MLLFSLLYGIFFFWLNFNIKEKSLNLWIVWFICVKCKDKSNFGYFRRRLYLLDYGYLLKKTSSTLSNYKIFKFLNNLNLVYVRFFFRYKMIADINHALNLRQTWWFYKACFKFWQIWWLISWSTSLRNNMLISLQYKYVVWIHQ